MRLHRARLLARMLPRCRRCHDTIPQRHLGRGGANPPGHCGRGPFRYSGTRWGNGAEDPPDRTGSASSRATSAVPVTSFVDKFSWAMTVGRPANHESFRLP